MKTIELNNSNTTLRLEGSEATRSMDLKSITVKEKPANGRNLKLTVLDEKDIAIYSQKLDMSQTKDGDSIAVDKRFVFYDHLSLKVEAEKEGDTYEVVLHFE